MTKKSKPFHSPFSSVKLPPKPAAVAPPAPAPKAKGPSTALSSTRDRQLTEADLWSMATEGADPLLDRSQRLRPKPVPIAHDLLDPELQAYDELRALVASDDAVELASTGSTLEGAARGLDPHLLHTLRRGGFPLQGRLDLHGLSRDVAQRALEGFVASARSEGKRCVLVIHGRGLHSPDQAPVLKEALRGWFSSGKLGRQVAAFCSARPQDGGAGAVYLLLQKP